jgi:hypothetical protein
MTTTVLDWLLRFDGRTSPALLDVLSGPVGASLLQRCAAHPDRFDLRSWREPRGRAHAVLAGQHDELVRLSEQAGSVDVAIAGAVVASGLATEDVAAAWPSLEVAVSAADAVHLRTPLGAAARLEALLANRRDPGLAVLARRLAPDVADAVEGRALAARLAGPLAAVLARHRGERGALPAVGAPAAPFAPELPGADAPALLALDERRSILVIEVADAADPVAAEVALVRARWWAELLGQWASDDALARVRLLDLLDQRRALGLVTAAVDDLRAPLRFVPVLAVGPGEVPDARAARLDALAAALIDTSASHPSVQRPERWVLDEGAGRRSGEEAAA